MTRRYDGATDRMIYTVDGESQLNNLKISALGLSLDSKDYVLPITDNMTVDIHANSKLTINQSAALLPGTKVNIAKTGELNVASGVSLYVYDGEGWGSFWNADKGQVQYAPGKKYTRSIEGHGRLDYRRQRHLDCQWLHIHNAGRGCHNLKRGDGRLCAGWNGRH
jgi:hypothetical protein